MASIRMDQDGKNKEVYATGIRNSVGIEFNPADRSLWFTDNQVDGMGDDQPPGELNRATQAGQNFGFPFYGGGTTRTVEYKDDQVPAGTVAPQVEMAAHAADLGLAFYAADVSAAVSWRRLFGPARVVESYQTGRRSRHVHATQTGRHGRHSAGLRGGLAH